MEVPLSEEEIQTRTVSRFREVLPQVLAISAANLVVMDMAVTLLFSTNVIAALHKSPQDFNSTEELYNATEGLFMDDTYASWFGGLPYICQPIGSFASGFLVTWLGRKRSLMLVCIPHVISCVLISTAPSLAVLFLANVIIGITVGLTEAPINSYFGEICQPTLRSALASCAALFYQFGMFLVLMLGSIMHWRTTAAVCVAAPIITIILISQIPESPIWLIAQDRKNDAEAALCWLRGWVEPSGVSKEMEKLLCYHENVTLKSALCASKSTQLQTLGSPEVLDVIPHHRRRSKWSPRSMGLIRLLLEPETLRPMVLTLVFFTLSCMGGMTSVKPFLVEVLHRFHSPLDPKWSSAIVAAAGFLGSVFLIGVVSTLGKRKLGLSTTAVCALCCFFLGLYALLAVKPVATWVPVTLFVVFSFSTAIQAQLPWLLVAESFPFRARGVAEGVAAAAMYLVGFLASKTYLATEHAMHLYGCFWFFCAINCVCFVYLFFQLPETEGKSLEEIERLFANNKRRSK
ncbi:facilitated trehalose transporter Tret1-like isoform X1 [Periplaneta americana]|uniref:facilitated trehalose transporter Tret1-like isoform X1 n=1 Tax=Periplaneta americana TaxID=6978 RepID=UPI0037E899FD